MSKRLSGPIGRSVAGLDQVPNPTVPAMVRAPRGPLVTMDEIEAFLDECRADPWFQSHPEVVDQPEVVLTKFYLSSEGPEWQAIWDQVHAILERFAETPVDRCQALAAVLTGVVASTKPH